MQIKGSLLHPPPLIQDLLVLSKIAINQPTAGEKDAAVLACLLLQLQMNIKYDKHTTIIKWPIAIPMSIHSLIFGDIACTIR